MNILIIGSGGREYSIGLKISQEKSHNLFFAPGNGATCNLGKNINIKDFNELANYVKNNSIDFTIVGPEDPLVAGIVDVFESHGLIIFGPNKAAAQLEGSKIYMKNFLKEHNIPTARFLETDSFDEASAFIDILNEPIVIKADGLCAGKGVIIANSKDEAKNTVQDMLSGESFGDAGKKVIVEEFLKGYELSVFAICDGVNYKVLPAAQDHKRLLDDDKGPNTGGMGAYAPTPLIDDEIYYKIENRIIKPTLKGMKERNATFKGVLFIGLMIDNTNPYVIEYNVRFGDPECEVLMPLIDTPVSELLYKASIGKIDEVDIKISNKIAVGVVMASQNYPYSSSEPAIIYTENVDTKLSHISYAGVSRDENNNLVTNGGRVLVCVGVGDTVQSAKDIAYKLASEVEFEGKQYRKDIAYQALNKQG